MEIKYLVETFDDNYENKLIERFYFDSKEQLQNWFNDNLNRLFNNGFIYRKILLSVIENGSDNDDK